jgi:hypothetical protein
MTTIAYNHKDKEIAYDSRSTSNGILMSDSVEKAVAVNNVIFFLCGCVCDNDNFIAMYFGDERKRVPEVSAIAVDNGKFYRCGVTDKLEFWKQEITHDDAIGSGMDWALAAMDFGKSAKEAVEYAKTRDIYTGGKVRTFKL